jgi:serine/threonine protein kinase
MDIKFENILIEGSDILVADFGSCHDRAGKERSTTHGISPRTDRYIPPKMARDPFAPKNYATDIWSLGVVFLEMVTILGGYKLNDFRPFLTQNGTKHKFVYANLSGMAIWTERLRENLGPDCDNEPLIWIQDMLRPQQAERLHASSLLHHILQSSSSGSFCRICCSDSEAIVDDTASYAESDISKTEAVEDVEDDWARLLTPSTLKTDISREKAVSIQAWIEQSNTIPPSVIEERKSIASSPETLSDEEELPYSIEDNDENISASGEATTISTQTYHSAYHRTSADFVGNI